MEPIEQYVLDQHIQKVDTTYEAFAKQIMTEQTAETFTVIFATDTHYIREYAPYAPVYEKIAQMVEFSGKVGADLLAITGDLCDGHTIPEKEYKDLYDVVSLVRNAKTTSVALSKGNHDDCSWYCVENKLQGAQYVIPNEQWFNHVINPLRVQYPMILDENNPTGGYYAVDDPFHKVRVLNLNTSDLPLVTNEDGTVKLAGQWNFGFREPQLRWVAKMLNLPGEGWSVLMMSHACPWQARLKGLGPQLCEPVFNGEIFTEIVKAFREKTRGTLRSDDELFPAEVTFDFTETPSNDMLPYLYGHAHTDGAEVVDGVTCVRAGNLLARRVGDGKCAANSWDCMLIDKKRRVMTCRRFGIPECDREISF